MYSVDKIYQNEIVIQKSRFICLLIPINNSNEVKEKLEEIKNKYKGATHYCYAYITKESQKYSDDGEPSGTAGNPILNVLKIKNLQNILAVVVRYFGGIKLGAGGLVRAYTKAVTGSLNLSNIITKEEGISLQVTISYDNINLLYKIINEKYIKDKNFDKFISININIPILEYLEIKEQLSQICCEIIEKGAIYI